MGTFDTHGGYFAPKDYMKVEAGGSHEENPNGGVQIGVDQQGVPNLLEEGEPVYKDYVYSDNIKASERFLKENNIPEKYAGELYSKIADSFFSEAENRPNDPISRNGLEAMLGRLADAQEGQKAYNEQRKLERELKQLSPDELAALEQMIATGEQMQAEQQPEQIQPEVAPEQVEPEQIAPEQIAPEQVPVMRNGGKVNKFVPGGDLYGGPGIPSYPLGGLDRFVDRSNTGSIQDTLLQMKYEQAAKDYARRWLEANGKRVTDANTNRIARDVAYSGLLEFNGNQVGVSPRGRRQRWLPMGEWNSHNGRYDFNLPEVETSLEMNGPEVPVSDDGFQYAGVVSGGLVDYPRPPESTEPTGARTGVANPGIAPINNTGNPLAIEIAERAKRDLMLDEMRQLSRPDDIVGRADTGGVGLLGSRPVDEAPDLSVYRTENTRVSNPYLSTFPRYAGAIGSGILGLYNALQEPDKYTATRYKPFVPTGRINLQNQVYNPVDQNMLMNQALAQGNSTMRGLRNSGLGPSTQAAMIAQDNNISGNLGNTFLQAWDANNQRRNQVIAANNQAEAQRAQFDYAVDAARQRALADAQMRNAYTDLQIQQLNNAAEADKYAAVGNQINNALQALSGIGRENYAMNQVNSNTALQGYGLFGGGVGAYLPYYYRERKCGGSIERKKK